MHAIPIFNYSNAAGAAGLPARCPGQEEDREMQNAKCRMQNVHHDLLPSLGRRKERVGGEPTRGRYCGGAVALKKAGGSAFPSPPGSGLPGADVAARGPRRMMRIRRNAADAIGGYRTPHQSASLTASPQGEAFMEVSSIGRTPASQAGKAGSIPVTSSNRFWHMNTSWKGVNCA